MEKEICNEFILNSDFGLSDEFILSDELVLGDELVLSNEFNLEIRDAGLEDAEKITEFICDIKDESRVFSDIFQDSSLSYETACKDLNLVVSGEDELSIIGIVDGEVVALARVVGQRRTMCAHNGELFVLVRRKYWEKGIFKAMIDKIIEKAKNKTKLKNINSILSVEDVSIIEAYEYVGFKKVGVYRDYYKIGKQFCHGIIMVLNI